MSCEKCKEYVRQIVRAYKKIARISDSDEAVTKMLFGMDESEVCELADSNEAFCSQLAFFAKEASELAKYFGAA